LLINR